MNAKTRYLNEETEPTRLSIIFDSKNSIFTRI